MNYNNNFNFYIEELMNHIYKQKLYKLAYKSNVNTTNSNINYYYLLINSISKSDILPDVDMEKTIRNYIESSSENYFMRKAMSIEKNYLYPKLFDSNNNPKVDYNYSNALITLWKGDMDEFYIEEAYNRFNKDSFLKFVKDNLSSLLNDISIYIDNTKENNKIVIECLDKDDLLDKIKSMILDKSLEFEWAEFLVDMNSLRNEMLTFAGDLNIYSEFDKLEDNTKYCLDNHCKYNSHELFDILTNDKGFIWIDGIGLVTK
ncbi:hypothetical protein [Clostridium sp.]|uniref:hypothetical protein n=1 Tax=Clostridium sp. TaxID=1506 RepID=UPI003F304E86